MISNMIWFILGSLLVCGLMAAYIVGLFKIFVYLIDRSVDSHGFGTLCWHVLAVAVVIFAVGFGSFLLTMLWPGIT